jgi:hypothetical protein
MSSSLSPAVTTVITGISEGRCLQIANSVTSANTAMTQAVTYQRVVINTAPSHSFANTISSVQANLTVLSNKIMLRGPIGFGVILGQIRSHIADSIAIKTSTNFISNCSFDDFGSNVTSISSMSTQGLDGLVGNLTAAANAIRYAGPCFDMSDIKTFGTPAGFIKKLKSVKLATASGVNAALANANVDTDNIEDPVYAEAIRMVLTNITDTKVIALVADYLDIPISSNSALGNTSLLEFTNSKKTVTSLIDFTDLDKLANAIVISGLTANLQTIGTKLSDMGASFKTVDAAVVMLTSLNTPNVANLNSFGSNLTTMMSNLASNVSATTGTGRGPLGVPNVTDFTHVVSGGPELSILTSNLNITESNISALSNAISKSTSLFAITGIDLVNQPTVFGLSSIKSFATSIFDIGADTSGSGANIVLANMVTNDRYGEAITSVLAEGKNNALLSAGGIQPPKFS